MKLYNSLGPNPRLVRMFLAEKGLGIPFAEVNLMGGENRRPPYTDKNPGGQLPALELTDGTVIAETEAICQYLEEVHPTPALIGTTPEERAETCMWRRRVELGITEPMANGFRFAEGLELFKNRVYCVPEAADGLKAMARERLGWLDGLIEGRETIVPGRFTLADITLYAFLDFGAGVGQPLDAKLRNLTAWYEATAARPSATASLHPASAGAGIRG